MEEKQEQTVAEPKSEDADKKEVMSTKKMILIMCSPILLPILIMAPIMIAMFVGCGWLFVAITFFGSASAAAIGICGIIGAFVNVANGIGAVLLAFGCGFIGLGLVFPVFIIAKEFFKGFLVLSRDIFAKTKDMMTKAKISFKNM